MRSRPRQNTVNSAVLLLLLCPFIHDVHPSSQSSRRRHRILINALRRHKLSGISTSKRCGTAAKQGHFAFAVKATGTATVSQAVRLSFQCTVSQSSVLRAVLSVSEVWMVPAVDSIRLPSIYQTLL